MAKMTIAQLREREVEKLARYKNPEPTEQDIAEAKRIMNSYYRLAGLNERLLYINNDERTYNFYFRSGELKRLEEQEDRWIKRIKNWLKEYGLTINYYSFLPTITDENGYIKVYAFYYN